MIERLQIQNFQSHKQTSLEFDPGVNVIIGPSDSGKTSIIRALRWLVWNRPLGDSFRSNWGGDTKVVAQFDNCQVERFKGKRDHYELQVTEQEEPLVFKAFGTEVPEEVQQAINLSEINLQHQMDAPFLISDTAGEVSRHFNKVARIDQIDSSLRNVESWVRSIRGDIKAAEEEIKRHEHQLEKFEYLDKMEADVEVLENLEGHKRAKGNQISRLSELISKIQEISTALDNKAELLKGDKEVTHLLTLYEKRKEKEEQFKELHSLFRKWQDIDYKLDDLSYLLENENIVNSCLQLYNKRKEAKDKRDKLQNLLTDIENAQHAIENEQEHLEILEEEWHREMPETCPLCGAKVNQQ